MVDLPEPVDPMTAVTSPRCRLKLRLRRVSSSASAKRKLTWSKRATGTDGSAATSSAGAFWSLTRGSTASTSEARVRHAMARGSCRMANWPIIMKNMMSMAYSTSADIDPICMACTPTRSAPSHTTRTSTTFMRKNVMQSAVANTRFTWMAFLA